ncbi:TonB-dependent receptor plug domain-containing protein [Bacteroidia bacterium]|nr:TonB-dependent receptor plug domain-containing protein [Bacteroidia bacterium]MDB9882446.1 TonB-dependent receptor plug domain-containing protein [Bacteroidia bacterium]
MRKILTLCSALFTLSLFAQTNLDSVMVSATRLNIKKYESGKHITTLTAKEIKDLPVTSVDELLQYLGGINLNSRGGFGVQSDIGMRGSTFSQVLVMVDNQRINDGLTSHFNSNIPIPLSEIHHIEIVRGSASASYGADAVGGIIHIKTKTYEGLLEDERSEFNGNIAYGDNKLTMTDAGFRSQGQRFGFSAAMKSSQSSGEQLVNPSYTNAGLGDSLYNNFFNLKTYTTAITYRNNKHWKVYARGGADSRDFAAKYFYSANPYDEATEKVNSYWTQAAVEYDNNGGQTALNIGYRHNQDSFIFNPLFSRNSHITERLNATISHNTTYLDTRLSFGLQTDYNSIESNDRGDHSLLNNAAFFLAHHKFNKLNVNAGLRLEYSNKIGAQLVPQVNVSLPHKNIVYRASAGRSIRQADFTEQYNFYLRKNTPGGFSIGNPDLEAESAYTFDIGLDAYISKNLKVTNTLFARSSSNLIDYTLTNSTEINNLINLQDSTNYFYAKNIKESFTFGNEFGLSYKMELPNMSIDWLLNYTYIQTNTPDSVISKYIANHPINNINGRATINFKRFTWNIGGTFITRNADEIPAIGGAVKNQYGILNTKLSYAAKEIPVSVFVNVRNLLDANYQEILGARMPRRWAMAGISWNFDYRKVKPVKY